MAKWLKFYKEKRPEELEPAAYIIDTLRNWHEGTKLPDLNDYEEEEDSAEGDSCFCKGTPDYIQHKSSFLIPTIHTDCTRLTPIGRSSSQLWIGCSDCGHWYHAACVGLTEKQVRICPHSHNIRPKPICFVFFNVLSSLDR